MRPLSWLRLALGVALVTTFHASLFGQSATSGAIRGYVKDEQGAVLADVAITAASPEAASDRTVQSSQTGLYRLTELPPGTYTVTAQRDGFAKYVRENIRVGAGQTLGLDLIMPVAGVTESVNVVHDPPVLEVSEAGQTLNITGDFQRDLPLTKRRSWQQFMELIPGVNSGPDLGGVYMDYHFHGSTQFSHVLQLDGMDVLGAADNSAYYVNFSTDAISDVHIKTATADASVPLGLGVVANVVTRSGTNTLRGGASLVYQRKDWTASNNPGGTTATTSLLQPDVTLGGPIVRDRAWFFGSYRHVDAITGISRTPTQLANLRALVSDFKTFDNTNEASLGTAKATYRVGQHEVMFGYEYDRNPRDGNSPNYGGPILLAASGGPWYSARLSSVFGPTLTGQFAVAYNNKILTQDGQGSGPSRMIYERVTPSSGGLTGINNLAILNNVPDSYSDLTSKWIVSADLFHVRNSPFGQHEFRFGMQLQRDNEGYRTAYANGGDAIVEEVLRSSTDPTQGSVPFHRTTFTPSSLIRAQGRARDISGYVQDQWRPVPRVAIAAGVRLDHINRRDVLFDRQVEDSLSVGPRFGTTVALTDSNQHFVHAAIGRIASALSETQISVGSTAFTVQDSYDTNLDGTFETTFVTPGATKLNQNTQYDPDFHQPHALEATAGYRGQFAGNVALDVAWLHRTYRDRRASIEVNGIYQNGVFVGYQDQTQSAISLITNNTYNWPVYNDITLQVSKRTARMQVLASYTRQWRHLEGTWVPNDPASFIQPDAFPNDRGIGSSGSTSTSSFSSNTNNAWRDHSARIAGTVNLGWDIQASADYTIQSGAWSGAILTTLAAPDPRFGPGSLTLPNGRLVSNPLAITTRFAYPTRSEGQLQADTMHIFNLRVSKGIKFTRMSVQIIADLYNLANGAADQGFVSTNMTSTSFGLGSTRQLPRAGQLGFRVAF